MKRIGLIAAVLLLIGAGAYGVVQWQQPAENSVTLETGEVAVADVRRLVSTSGKVRALVTVEVGSQLSGQIAELGADFNSQVAEGDVIARLDPKTFEARVSEAEATVAVAQAGVAVQAAAIARVRANLSQAEDSFRRAEALVKRGNMSAAAYDNAKTALATSQAEVAVAEAQLANAKATLRQRQAALKSARIDLERTIIRAPIDGVVIDRAIDLGQTVAAAMNAPKLFVIAQDLREVQIDAQVDEADIGQVEEGQTVKFTVDAHPDVNFEGRVQQIRLAGVEAQNVVTYTVVIAAANPRRLLLPGMTANVDIVTGERAGVLTVPNGALRFRPRGGARALVQRSDQEGGRSTRILERLAPQLEMTPEQVEQAQAALKQAFAGMAAQMTTGDVDREAMRQRFRQAMSGVLSPAQLANYDAISERVAQIRFGSVWVRLDDGKIAARRVRLGISDARVTEVSSDALNAGDVVVLRAREAVE
ncbi:MAG: efflux RND transporter periplasmic adaptor subunit [Alphaproteobacteria bacterium]